MLTSCQHSVKVSGQGDLPADTLEDEGMTQTELNWELGEMSVAYDDSIEAVFQKVVDVLPEVGKETAVWEAYQTAVGEVARYEDHGSSTPMYVCDVINQGITLREVSVHNLWRHLQGEKVVLSKTQFTDAMIDEAYAAFIEAQKDVAEQDEQAAFQQSIHKELQCWKDWMACRATIARNLPADIRKVYDDCTNLIKRTKLLQLKNQNRTLGLTSEDAIECALSNECSDKELLDYPGFDKVWEQYLAEFE